MQQVGLWNKPPIQLSGDIQARVETQLSFRVGGKIIERKVDVGDQIGRASCRERV